MLRLNNIFLFAVLALSLIVVSPAAAETWTTVGDLKTDRCYHTATLLPDGRVLVAGGRHYDLDLDSCEIYDPATASWASTGDLNTPRFRHTATLLPNGKVLVAGGYTGSYNLDSCELYDPSTGSWTVTGNLKTARSNHTATLLPDGTILVASGGGSSGNLLSSEIYNPSTASWTLNGNLKNARYAHTATLLSNGKVLVAGGFGGASSCELYDPDTGIWTTTDDLISARSGHTATLLSNGKVLVAGGSGGGSSCELYDPDTKLWTTTDAMDNAREWHTATLLPDGKVLVAGGFGSSDYLKSCEVYDPATESWIPTEDLAAAREIHTATLLPNGNILVAGGVGPNYLDSCEIYDSANGFWTATDDDLNSGRDLHTATLLSNGKVLVAGGRYGTYLQICELYDLATGIWTTTDDLNTARYNHTATLLSNSKVLVTGGFGGGSSCELYDPLAESWSSTGNLINYRARHTATLLSNGKVLVAGGYYTGSGFLSSCKIFDPATENWAATDDLNASRESHTATLLPNGKVLVAGGYAGSYYLDSCELYDPATGKWETTGDLHTARLYHTATMLPNGKVLVTGGYGGASSCELYDPNTGIWTTTGNLNTARYNHTATLLSNGKVLVAGGYAGSYYLDSCELYDPNTGTWTATDSFLGARSDFTATLLPDGTVLVVGGKNSGGYLDSSEIYDPGLGFAPSWRPLLDTVTSPLEVGHVMYITGTGFRGISEASGGNGFQNSSTNYPLVQLRRIDSQQSLWLPYDPVSGVSETNFTSKPISDFPDGHALVTVFTNGIPSESEIILVDNPPKVSSIVRSDSNPTNSGSVDFFVSFSERVTGVDAGDFSLYETGSLTGSSISSVTGSIDTYTVTVSGYSGEGTLKLDVIDDDSIVDALGFTLGGTGLGNGDYTTGEAYDIDLIAPFLAMAAVQLDGLSVEVTFSESMGSGVTTAANYAISGDGKGTLSTNPDSVDWQSHNTYRLIWSTGEMLDGGDVTITVSNVQDSVGNLIDSPNSATDFGGGIGEAPTTSATPPGGSYDTPQTVLLSCVDDAGSGCAIYYSTDGSPPSTPYTGPFSIDQFTELKFFSQDNAGNTEEIKSQVYYINIVTEITCNLSPDTITFGETSQVTGEITPAPNEAGRGVDVAFIPSEGATINLTTWTDINGSFTLDVECGGVTKAGTWTVQTSWAGDASHLGDTSDPEELTVNQAETDLTLDVLMSEAIKVNSRPLIGGNFTPEPYCADIDLEGTEILLHVTEPSGVTVVHTLKCCTNQYGQYILDYDDAENGGPFDFDTVGDWTIYAEFVGTDEYASAQTSLRTIHVIPTSGYAILIQGRVYSGEGLASHHKTASFVYDKLLGRQILPDDIQYFSWVYREGWDGDPSRSNIQDAITVWARDKMDPNFVHPDPEQDDQGQAGDLYIIMINHGWTDAMDSEKGLFYIHPDEPLTSTELSAWVSDLQDNLVGTVSEDRNIVFILGFCRAGACIKDLSDLNYPNRVIIASAAKDEASHRGPQDVDENDEPLRDGEYFVTEFFKSVSYGKSITQCFEDATFLTEAFTSSGSGEVNAPYFDDSVQHPLLDDNADDKGSNELTMEEDTDGVFSEFLYIGTSPPEGNDPGDVLITKVNEDRFLGIADTTVNLWADVDVPLDVRLIWIEVKAPNYNPGDPGAGQQIVMDTFKKGTTTVDVNRYSWADVGGGGDPADLFSTPGTYQIFYFAKDKDTGNVSPLMESRVYKAIDSEPPNAPPYEFNLVSPEDGAEVLTTFILDWQDTTDPEGDSLTYTVLLSEGDALFTDPIRIEALKYSTCLAVPEDGIKDRKTYYWKVWAIDEYGAYTEAGVSQFATNNSNPPAAWIEGHVYNSITGAPIANAIISVSSLEFNTELNGYYIGTTSPGTFTVSASAEGYMEKSYPGVFFPDGGIVTRDFGLEPLGAGSASALPAILLLLLGE